MSCRITEQKFYASNDLMEKTILILKMQVLRLMFGSRYETALRGLWSTRT